MESTDCSYGIMFGQGFIKWKKGQVSACPLVGTENVFPGKGLLHPALLFLCSPGALPGRRDLGPEPVGETEVDHL